MQSCFRLLLAIRFSIAQNYKIAKNITASCRNDGHVFSRPISPSQTIEDGTVLNCNVIAEFD